MADKVKLGMVGAGFIGQLAHLQNYIEVENCDVVALAEFRPELRARMGKHYDIPRLYETHTELLNDDDIDAVIVVTPRPFTGPTVLDCLNAKKAVLSEKPMAATIEQARTLVQAAESNSVKYTVGYMKRYDEGVQYAKSYLDKVIESKELGELVYARAHCFTGDSYCKADGHLVSSEKPDYSESGWNMWPDWLPEKYRKLYEVYINTYSHNINLLRYLFGSEPSIEYSRVAVSNGQVVILKFGEISVTLETGMVSNRGWDEVTEFYFTDGHLKIFTPPALLKNVPARVEIYRAGQEQVMLQPQMNWTWAFRRQAQSFVNDIQNGTESISSGADSYLDVELIENFWKKDLN